MSAMRQPEEFPNASVNLKDVRKITQRQIKQRMIFIERTGCVIFVM